MSHGKCGNCYDGKLLMPGEQCGQCGNSEPKKSPRRKKRYNVQAHRDAVKARHEAVLFLLSQGYSLKAAGYAVGKTGEFARSAYAKAKRRVERSAQFAPNHTRHNPLG